MEEPKGGKTPVAKPKTLTEKLFNVQQAVKTVIKGGENTHHGYKYAREIDIIGEIKPLLGKERLLITSTTISHELINEKLHEVGVRHTITDVDDVDEAIDSVVFGVGEDKAGSAVGLPIAYTMSLKYFLAKTFLIETGDDVEKDKSKPQSEDERLERATLMINGSHNVAGLIQFSEELKTKKGFNPENKKKLQALISTRVDAISNKQ